MKLTQRDPIRHSQKVYTVESGEGETLFFQHGLTAQSQQIVDLLGGVQGVHLLSMDSPGHGSSVLQEGYQLSFDQYADELIHQLDIRCISRVFLGGLSMGSGIALNIALRYPERVRGLILLRPAWLDRPHPDNLDILLEALPYLKMEGGARDFENTSCFQTLRDSHFLAARSVLGIFSPLQQDALDIVIRSMVGDCPFTNIEELVRIDVPTLVIGNDDDPLHPFEIAQILSHSITHASLVKVPSRYEDATQHRREVRDLVENFIFQNKKKKASI